MNSRHHGALTLLFYQYLRWKETRQPDNHGKRRTARKNERRSKIIVVRDSSLTFTYAQPLNPFQGAFYVKT